MARIFLLCLVVALAGCSVEPAKEPVPLFKNGSFVKAKISGSRGMVIETDCYPGWAMCLYDVRFPALQMTTDTHVFGSDGPVMLSPLAIVSSMHEYELEASN